MSRALQDVGLELTPATQRLAAFNAVQNTYLNTFQVLGGLGLLLGSAGLGVVVLRNVLERRGIFVSGVLFGERTSLSEAYDFRLPAIEVHFVEGGSLGQTAEVEPSDLVEEIDGQAVATLADVDAQFRAAMQAGRPSVRLTFRRFEFDQGMYVNAVERTLALDGYRWIGGTGEAR